MDDALDALRGRDELLQILYWFRGEGLGEVVIARDLVTFLDADIERIGEQLERLGVEGYVAVIGGTPTRYQLTEWGIKEGGRRFADEFSGLTGQAHGECSNPNCVCQTLGPATCESRVAHAH
ncbi:MAG TPA: hypothetical protein VGR16_12730 [Thermomicrobiales bacterium]|nr:hypothetical protein [Thermomicrobiales bacterium]